MGLTLNIEVMRCHFSFEGDYFKCFDFKWKYQAWVKKKNKNKHQNHNTSRPQRWNRSEGCYQDEQAQGRSKNLILDSTKADGAGNVALHPHTTNSQEQRGLIQNRRQHLGWAGCQAHLSSSPGSTTHSFSLCFSLSPIDSLASVGKLSTCYLPQWFCHVSFAQHHKHDPRCTQEGPEAQQGSSPHTRMPSL